MGRIGTVAGVLCFWTCSNLTAAATPAWWTDSTTGFIDGSASHGLSDNYSPANQGQLKNVATKAALYLNNTLPGGAGSEINNMVTAFGARGPNDYSPINLGQLKAVAKPFYDRLKSPAINYNTKARLIAQGYPSSWGFDYPWDPTTSVSSNYSPANLGQLKMAFSFDLTGFTAPTPTPTPTPSPPVVTVPVNITVTAPGSSGAVVTFTTTAVNGLGASIATVNTPVSGSTFPVGSTTVTARATDAFGQTTSKTFVVWVNPAGILNRANGGTATASADNPPKEAAAKAFDGSTGTKWYCGSATGSLAYQFGGNASWVVTQYAITSANDVPARDPKNWQFQGSNDGTTWTTLDTRTNQTFNARYQTNTYSIANSTAYARYRLNITSNVSGTALQLSEFSLFASLPLPVINSPLTASGLVGTTFGYTITATNSPTSLGATGLPAGLSVNATTGVISGTPTAAAVSNVILSATNAAGTVTKGMTLTVTSTGPTPTPTPAPPVVTVPVNITVTAPGSSGAVVTFTTTAVNGQGAAIPTVNTPASGSTFPVGSTTVTARANDAFGQTTSKTFVVWVNPAGFLNRANGGTATASSDKPPNEAAAKAFDGSAATKWYCGNATGWLAYQFGGNASWVVTQYTVSSANDVPARDPKNWQFQGSNDGTTWTTLETQTNQTFNARYQTNTYPITNSAAYLRYRLNITGNSGDTGLQLSELGLFASLRPPVITSPLTASGVVGTTFSYITTATNSPTSFGATGLPAGLSVNATSGVISGTPTAAAVSNVTLSATNAAGTVTQGMTLTVTSTGPTPTPTPTIDPNGDDDGDGIRNGDEGSAGTVSGIKDNPTLGLRVNVIVR